MTTDQRAPRRGRGLAIATIIVSAVVLLIWAAVVWLFQADVPDETNTPNSLRLPFFASLFFAAHFTLAAIVLGVLTAIRSRSGVLKTTAVVLASMAVFGTVAVFSAV